MAFLKKFFDTREILDERLIMFFFLNPANHIEFFSVISRSDMEPACILLNISPITIWEVPTRPFQV